MIQTKDFRFTVQMLDDARCLYLGDATISGTATCCDNYHDEQARKPDEPGLLLGFKIKEIIARPCFDDCYCGLDLTPIFTGEFDLKGFVDEAVEKQVGPAAA